MNNHDITSRFIVIWGDKIKTWMFNGQICVVHYSYYSSTNRGGLDFMELLYTILYDMGVLKYP